MEIQSNLVGSRMINEGRDAAQAGAPKAGADKADLASGGAKEGARVVLSDKARSMMALRSEVDSAADVRTGLVAELSQRISAGTYDVRGQMVAEAMVRHAAFEAIA